MQEHKTYTTHEIAEICDVYPSTVVHWIEGGKLKAHRTPGGHHRVTRDSLRAFLTEFGMPMPAQIARPAPVMIVEDEPEVSHVLEKAFRQYPKDFQATVYATGTEALLQIGKNPPALVVLDIVLPGMDGLQVCSILKSREDWKRIRIVAMSGRKLSAEAEKRLKGTVDAFYRKPLDLDALVGKAAELLRLELGRPAAV